MILFRYIPRATKNNHLVLSHYMLSGIPNDIATTEVRTYPAIGELLDPQVQLSKLEGIAHIKEPSSLIDNVPYACQNVLDFCQVSTGVPWWGILIGAGITARIITLPFHVNYEKSIMMRLPSIKLEKEAVLSRMSGEIVLSAKKLHEASVLQKSAGLKSSFWLLRYFIPGTMLMTLNYLAIHGLTSMHYAPILETGFLWLPSLCLDDPDRVLSFFNGIFIAANIQRFIINTPDSQKSDWITSNKKLWFLTGFVAIAFQAKIPSAVLLYWTSSNATRLFLIDILLKTDLFRKSVGLVSIAEKREAYESIPKVPTPSALKIIEKGTISESHIVEADKALKNDLSQLLADEDFELYKIKTEEQKEKLNENYEKLENDLQFCEDKLGSRFTSLYTKFPNSMSSHYQTQKQIIKDKMNDSQKQIIDLKIMDFKREFSERKKAMANSSVTDQEQESHMEQLYNTHTKLLSQLEECERDIITISSSKEMQHFELFAKKQELLYRQKDIIKDIEFCEKEILGAKIVPED